MSGGKIAIGILVSSILGAIAYYVVRVLLTDLCANTTVWSAIEVTLYCTIFPVAVIIAIILLVFKNITAMNV